MQYLVIDLDYNVVRGVFATPQEAETYVDTVDTRGYRSNGFMITPVEIVNGKIQPDTSDMEDLNADDDSVEGALYDKYKK